MQAFSVECLEIHKGSISYWFGVLTAIRTVPSKNQESATRNAWLWYSRREKVCGRASPGSLMVVYRCLAVRSKLGCTILFMVGSVSPTYTPSLDWVRI